MYLILASSERITMQALGDITLVLEIKCLLKLKNCLYVPKFRKNPILASSLNKWNYSVYFNKELIIGNNNSFIFLDPLVDNLYHITPFL